MTGLWCYIEGKRDVFEISIPIRPSNHIGNLKKEIYNQGPPSYFGDCAPMDIILIMVDVDLREVTRKAKVEGGYKLDANEQQTELSSHENISQVWPEPHPEHLHVFIHLPGKERYKPDPLPPNTCLRSETVSALYKKINKYSFVLVRGTPASGKSTLVDLLADYIYHQEPTTHVIKLWGWDTGGREWREYLDFKGWEQGTKTVFIFDEAQVSYKDSQLWGQFIKELPKYNDRFAIAFASYGSPSTRIEIQSIPVIVTDTQRVSLCPVDHGDGLGAAGLLFTQTEFDDLIQKQFSSGYYFDLSFFNGVFSLTGGHVGATVDFVGTITGLDSYRLLRQTAPGQLYTWDLFLKKVNMHDLIDQLGRSAYIFMRGLPVTNDLKKVPTAHIFSCVLGTGSIDRSDTEIKEDAELRRCFHNGWLHADKIPFHEGTTLTFPSELHRLFVEWKLRDTADPIPFEAKTPLELSLKVISGFSARLVSTDRIGPGFIQRPPEAQYQDEFYRSCYAYSKGSLLTFPEFGTAKGRVDFYIPIKKWGVELLRDGDQLEKHSSRFSDKGAYGTILGLSDYIILDFRKTWPKRRHTEIRNLYHVVMGKDYQVNVLNNSLRAVDGGEMRLLFGQS